MFLFFCFFCLFFFNVLVPGQRVYNTNKRNTTLTTIKQLTLQESLYLYERKFRNHTVNDGDQDASGTSFNRLGEAIPITKQVSARLNKPLSNPISLQYIHRNYHVVKQAEMVLAFTSFQPESNLCFGGTGWAVEMAKLLKKILYVYDVQRNIWFWYRHDQDLFYACDQMSEEQFALPTFLPKTAIVGIRNIYDFPDALLELQDTFKRSLNISV